MLILELRYCGQAVVLVHNFADGRPATSDELVRDERVHDLLRSAGSSGMPVLRACGTDGCSSGCAADEPGDLLANAGVAGYEREHSALQVLLSAGDGVPGLVREHSALQVSPAAAVERTFVSTG